MHRRRARPQADQGVTEGGGGGGGGGGYSVIFEVFGEQRRDLCQRASEFSDETR